MNSRHYEKLEVRHYADRQTLGRAAADHVRGIVAAARAARGVARVVFACAPSQNEFFRALVAPPHTVPWADVIVFHSDEFVGLSASQPQSSRHYLRAHLLDAIPAPHGFHALRGEAPSLPAECERYALLLRERPIDLVCLGLGGKGHIAFNDPAAANFDDAEMVKVVELDEMSREQQVHDGCFAREKDVPTHALTLTIPALFSARAISCIAAGPRKAGAVQATASGPILEACPASILRAHPNAVLHIDAEAAAKL